MNDLRRKVNIVHDHTPVEGNYHEWVQISAAFDQDAHYYGDAIGRRHNGWYRWDRYVCNNPDCEGEAYVSAVEIDKLIGELIDSALPTIPEWVEPEVIDA